MTLKVVTAPSYKPVSLAAARTWMRVDDDDTTQDAMIVLLLGAMADYAENLTGRAFVERTLRLTLPGWPYLRTAAYFGVGFALPQAPLVQVDSLKYYDTAGVQQTLAADQYVVHTDPEPGLIVPAWQVTWPDIRPLLNAIEVNYVAGYAPVGSPPGDETAHQNGQPEALRLWIAARAATIYENREQVIATGYQSIPRAFADGLLDSLVLGERLV